MKTQIVEVMLLDSCFSLYKLSFPRAGGVFGCGPQQLRVGLQHCWVQGGGRSRGCCGGCGAHCESWEPQKPQEQQSSLRSSISASHGCSSSCLGFVPLGPAPECCNSMGSGHTPGHGFEKCVRTLVVSGVSGT